MSRDEAPNLRTKELPQCCFLCKNFDWNHEMCEKYKIYFDGKSEACASICDSWEAP